MRLSWISVVPKTNDGYPYERKGEDRLAQRSQLEDWDRGCSDVSTGQGVPQRLPVATRSWEGGMKWILPQSFQKEPTLNTLSLDFWDPELWEYKTVTQVVVMCQSSPGTVICLTESIMLVWERREQAGGKVDWWYAAWGVSVVSTSLSMCYCLFMHCLLQICIWGILPSKHRYIKNKDD